MSVRAVSWAFEQKLKTSSKLVLLALADYVGQDGEAYPSIETLESKTSLERKAIFRALRVLKDIGYIEDTGERRGSTKRITVYRITDPKGEQLPKGNYSQSVLEIVPEREQSKEPGNIQGTVREPSVLLPLPPQGGRAVGKELDGFEEFWLSIHKENRIAKGKAREAWCKAIRAGNSSEDILDGVDSYRSYEKKRRQQNDYRPLHPSTWINQERWNDGQVSEPSNGEQKDWVNESIYG